MTIAVDKYIIRTHDRLTFKDCRQKWYFSSRVQRNLEINVTSEHLVFGTDVHAGLEDWYHPNWIQGPKEPQYVRLQDNEAVRTFHDAWAKRKEGVRLNIHTWDEYDDLGEDMLRGYFDYAREHDKFKPVRTEVEFEIPIPVPRALLDTVYNRGARWTIYDSKLHYKGLPVVYQGRLDLLAQDDEGYIIVDHKTAGKFNPTAHLEMDEQVASYAWAMRQVGVDVHTIIYNELKKASPEQPKVNKNGSLSKDKTCVTTPELYKKALAANGLSELDYLDHLAWLEANAPQLYRRTIVRKTAKELDIIGERILLEALDMLDDPSIYPHPTSNYNCVKCDFRMPCLATNDGSNVEAILQRGYRQRVD